MLKIDLKPGESVAIGSHAIITLESKSGQIARIAIDADKSVPVNKVRPQASAAKIAAEGGLAR